MSPSIRSRFPATGVDVAIEAPAAVTGDAADGFGIAAGTPLVAPVASTEVALATV
ncbi:hypothetical protein [Streptomyces sp. NPDC001070]